MNFFHLFAHGEAFDPDAFLAASLLRPDHVWRRGDRRRSYPADVADRQLHETGGVEFVLGNGREIPWPKQEQVALDFIAAHRDELRALGAFPGVAHYILMFHYEREFEGDTVGGYVEASRQLMRVALDIGCRVNFTFVLNRRATAGPGSEEEIESDSELLGDDS